MDKRRIAVPIALTVGAALLFVRVTPHGHSVSPTIGVPAAAQTPSPTLIQVKYLPNTGGNDEDPWQRFDITVPPSNPPLDMHVAFLVDGKGTEVVDEEPHAWSQPILFKYRLDSDDDSRVKTILEAQGLPVKKNLVTYEFASRTNGGGVGFENTIRFQHEPGGYGKSTAFPSNTNGAIGEKIVLDSRIISDTDFKGNFEKDSTFDQWTKPEFAPKTSPGLVKYSGLKPGASYGIYRESGSQIWFPKQQSY